MEGNTPVVFAAAQKGGGPDRIGGAHWPHDSLQAAGASWVSLAWGCAPWDWAAETN